MTTSEVARTLRVHRNTVDRERLAGRLRAVRVGKRVFFTEWAVRNYLELQEEEEGRS